MPENELMIVLDCSPARWIYFKTHETTLKEALGDFYSVCELSGINMDNAPIKNAVLRNDRDVAIDWTNRKENHS